MHDRTYRIPVKDGDETHYALVSAEDYERFAGDRWYLVNGYARLSGSTRRYLHRELLGLKPGDGHEGDHINRDRLDNRRENLRVVTHKDNGRNVPSQAGSSRFRGVCWDRRRQGWLAQATFDRKHHNLGRFASETDAARIVNAFWVERGYPAPNLVD